MENIEWLDIAKEVLLAIDAISTCDVHEEYYFDTGKYDAESIYGPATNKYKSYIHI